MNRKRIQRAGFMFGIICRNLGAVFGMICLALIPNDTTIIDVRFLIPAVISIASFIYGTWRTGGIYYDEP